MFINNLFRSNIWLLLFKVSISTIYTKHGMSLQLKMKTEQLFVHRHFSLQWISCSSKRKRRDSLMSVFSCAALEIIQKNFETSIFVGKYAPIDLQKMTLEPGIFQFFKQIDSRHSTIKRLHRATAIIPTLKYSPDDWRCECMWIQSIFGIQKGENNFCKTFWMRFSIGVISTLSPMRAALSTCYCIEKCIESTTHRRSLCRCGCLQWATCYGLLISRRLLWICLYVLFHSLFRGSFILTTARWHVDWIGFACVVSSVLLRFWCHVWGVCCESVLETQRVGPTHWYDELAGTHRDHIGIEIDSSHGVEIVRQFLLIMGHPMKIASVISSNCYFLHVRS